MKYLQSLFILFLMLLSSKEIVAQRDSLSLQRKAKKLLRQGNELYEKKQYTDASVAYQKALGANNKYDKATYNLGNALYQNKNFKEAIPQYELTAETAKDKFTKAAGLRGCVRWGVTLYGARVDGTSEVATSVPRAGRFI